MQAIIPAPGDASNITLVAPPEPPPVTTCSSCKHWRKHPVNPHNLAAPTLGECRAVPPQVVFIPTNGGGTLRSQFPVLPPNFEACGMHEAA